jgi:hypothetical protein
MNISEDIALIQLASMSSIILIYILSIILIPCAFYEITLQGLQVLAANPPQLRLSLSDFLDVGSELEHDYNIYLK